MNFQKQPLAAGLHLVGVPIGSARDITLRALDILASADIVAAEDTRSMRHLMSLHGVPLAGRQIISLHEHTSAQAINALAQKSHTHSIAYSSEAGMPLIADPGFELVRAVRALAGHVTCAPGPSAFTAALAMAGLPTDAVFFAGFLPATQSARRRALKTHQTIPATLVYYESPRRLAKMLSDAAHVLGDERKAIIARELTKKFEEIKAGTLGELAELIAKTAVKGEICVLIERSLHKIKTTNIEKELSAALQTMTLRDAVDHICILHDLPRRHVYQQALAFMADRE